MAPELGGEPARGRDAQLAGIGAGARGDVGDGLRPAGYQARRLQPGVQLGQVGVREPTEQHVLVSGKSERAARELARQVAHDATLLRCEVAERQRHDGARVARLRLRAHVGGIPGFEARRTRRVAELLTRLLRSFVERVKIFEEGRPSMTQGWGGTLDQLETYLGR